MPLVKRSNKPRGFVKGKSGNPAGKKKGTLDRRTLAKKLGAEIIEKGLMPLDYMLQTLRDKKIGSRDKQWAASQAAPYLHRKMPISVETGPEPEEAARLVRQALAAIEEATQGEE